jgi:Fic family protein
VAFIKGAQATTAIEGNTLTEEEIRRSLDGEDLPPSKEYQEREVKNVLTAMNTLGKEILVDGKTNLIDADFLCRLHRAVGEGLGEHFDAIPGQFRTDNRTVGPYQCPDFRDVPELVDRLTNWLRVEFGFSSGNQSFFQAVIEAIVTHVYIEWIHAFGDGNGRTGRLVEFYILLRKGLPDIATHILSNFYNLTRPRYYRELDRARTDRDLTSFIAYAIEGLRDGLVKVLKEIQEIQLQIAWEHFIFESFRVKKVTDKLLKRRRALALEMGREKVKLEQIQLLTPEIARRYANLSLRTLRRDLKALVSMGLVEKSEDRYRSNAKVLLGRLPRQAVPRALDLRDPRNPANPRAGAGLS